MLLGRICKATILPKVSSLLKAPVVAQGSRGQVARLYGNEGRNTFSKTTRYKDTFNEDVAGQKALNMGKGIVAGSAVMGLGALCYYGAGLSSEAGIIDRAGLWPQYVKDRIKTTYMYFGGSILATGAVAAACFRSELLMVFLCQRGLLALGISFIALMGTIALTNSIPYQEGFGAKQMAWLLHCATMGAFLAPLSFFGGALLVRAALYTAGVVGGLSAVAICAPSEKFLAYAGPVGMGLGVVAISSLASLFLSTSTALGAGVWAICLYGGLVVFSAELLVHTQKLIKQAETFPVDRKYDDEGKVVRGYDPVDNALLLYLTTVNIFVRILSMLADAKEAAKKKVAGVSKKFSGSRKTSGPKMPKATIKMSGFSGGFGRRR